MKKLFTPQYIEANKGCYSFEQVRNLSFMSKKEITIGDIIDSEISLEDKFWFVLNKINLSVRQKQDLAIMLAEAVLEIYEKRYLDNKAPREAIQAAKDYLNGTITKEILLQKRHAAAYAAAYAADAADAYAAAAAAATATATATATAAAAATAATAYADAAAAAARQSTLLVILKSFITNQESE